MLKQLLKRLRFWIILLRLWIWNENSLVFWLFHNLIRMLNTLPKKPSACAKFTQIDLYEDKIDNLIVRELSVDLIVLSKLISKWIILFVGEAFSYRFIVKYITSFVSAFVTIKESFLMHHDIEIYHIYHSCV